MNSIFQKIKTYFTLVMKHKFISALIMLAVIGVGYYGYQKFFTNGVAVHYAFAQVQKGTFIVSLSGSGQVSASNQVDIKPKTSGDVIGVYMTPGQKVEAGQLVVQIDSRDAERVVRDAETALETAKLELDKLLAPVDELTLLQSENSLTQAKETKQKAEDDFKKSYEDGFTGIANTFLALPDVMTGLQNILYSSSRELGGTNQWNADYYAGTAGRYNDAAEQFKQDVYDKYQIARSAYDKNFIDYKAASRFSDQATIAVLINETYDTVKIVSDAIKSSNNLIQLYQDELTKRSLTPAALSSTHLSILNSYTGTTNTHLTNLLSSQRTIKDSGEAIVSADRTIKERELSLAKIKNGADDLDVRTKKIAIQQRGDALVTARQTLADTAVRAPFAGIIAKVNAKREDSVSSGTAIATLITRQKLAEVSLNEVDVAQVKIGQKAMLTFDAVPHLTITGQVAEIDAVGTVSQGVVTYNVKIAFDTQDERIKPSMSVSAIIVTEAKPNVLLVPNSAVKSQGGMSYVEIVEGNDQSLALAADVSGAILKNIPRRQLIEVGTVNDEFTEIVGGLNEGDVIVTRTIQPNSTQSTQTQQQQGGLRIPGLPGGGVRGGGGFGR